LTHVRQGDRGTRLKAFRRALLARVSADVREAFTILPAQRMGVDQQSLEGRVDPAWGSNTILSSVRLVTTPLLNDATRRERAVGRFPRRSRPPYLPAAGFEPARLSPIDIVAAVGEAHVPTPRPRSGTFSRSRLLFFFPVRMEACDRHPQPRYRSDFEVAQTPLGAWLMVRRGFSPAQVVIRTQGLLHTPMDRL